MPYRIIIFDLRPNLDDGITHLYEFETDTAIPNIEIPLEAALAKIETLKQALETR